MIISAWERKHLRVGIIYKELLTDYFYLDIVTKKYKIRTAT